MNPPFGFQPPFTLTDANGFYTFGDGSNLKAGNTNPPYTSADFLSFYPQFGNNTQGVAVVPTTVIDTFVTMATGALNSAKWNTQWLFGMHLYIAHFCTLYLQTVANPDGAAAVFEAGRARGVVTSESAGDLSVSYDPNLAGRDTPTMAGWGAFHLTAYGQQFVTLARIVGLGGMYIY